MARVRASLKPEHWPAADAKAWQDARIPARRFSAGGTAGHLRASTAKMLEGAYGHYLAFCTEAELVDADLEPAGAVTPDLVNRFTIDQQHRCGSVTVAARLARILRMARLLAPNRDLGWLADLAADLKAAEQPRAKSHRIVDSSRLLDAGLRLMQQALKGKQGTALENARQYRNGLMVALLAVHPIRLGNFATLRIGHELRCEQDGWWIMLEPEVTKSGRADERRVADVLCPWIDRWVDDVRHVFLAPGDAMWPSTKGGSLAYTFVGQIVSKTTRQAIGIDVSPHLFRDCAVYTIATRDGHHMGTASALLQHTDPRTTDRHYNKGHTHLASRKLQAVVDKLGGDVE